MYGRKKELTESRKGWQKEGKKEERTKGKAGRRKNW